MSDDRHHTVSSQRPVPGSHFAFYVAGYEILDRYPAPDFSSPELPITSGMTKHERRHAELWNSFVRHARETTRGAETRSLIAAGMLQPGQDILSRSQANIVDRLTDNMLRDMDAIVGTGPGIARFSCPDRAMVGERLITRKRSATRAAKSLNEGISRRAGGAAVGLTRDHVHRAWLRFAADPFVRTRHGAGLALTIVVNQHRALKWLLDQAERSSLFPSLRGAELARAIDHRCYLPFLIGESGLPFIDLTMRAA